MPPPGNFFCSLLIWPPLLAISSVTCPCLETSLTMVALVVQFLGLFSGSVDYLFNRILPKKYNKKLMISHVIMILITATQHLNKPPLSHLTLVQSLALLLAVLALFSLFLLALNLTPVSQHKYLLFAYSVLVIISSTLASGLLWCLLTLLSAILSSL